MNRKQKKAKRLRATQHTKAQACYKPVQPIVFNRQSAEACLNRKDEFNSVVRSVGMQRNTNKFWLVIVVICMLITLWMFKVNT